MRRCSGDDGGDDDGVSSKKHDHSASLCVVLRCGGDGAFCRHGWTSLLRDGGRKRADSGSSSQLSRLPWSLTSSWNDLHILLTSAPVAIYSLVSGCVQTKLHLLQNWTETVAGTISHLSKTRNQWESLDFSHRAGGASESVSFIVPDESNHVHLIFIYIYFSFPVWPPGLTGNVGSSCNYWVWLNVCSTVVNHCSAAERN